MTRTKGPLRKENTAHQGWRRAAELWEEPRPCFFKPCFFIFMSHLLLPCSFVLPFPAESIVHLPCWTWRFHTFPVRLYNGVDLVKMALSDPKGSWIISLLHKGPGFGKQWLSLQPIWGIQFETGFYIRALVWLRKTWTWLVLHFSILFLKPWIIEKFKKQRTC